MAKSEEKRKKVQVPIGEHDTKLSERIFETIIFIVLFVVASIIIFGLFQGLSNTFQFIIEGLVLIFTVHFISDSWTKKKTIEYKKVFEDELTGEDRESISTYKEKAAKEAAENKKPFYMNWKIYFTVIVLIVFVLIGKNIDKTNPLENNTTTSTTVAVSEKTTITTTNQNVDKIVALVNQPLKDALKTVGELGYTAKYTNAQSNYDFTETITAFDETELEKWVIVECVTIDTAAKKVEFSINTKENIQENEKNEQIEKALSEKLSSQNAWNAVIAYGNEAYPYGFKVTYSNGFTEKAKDENTWFLKARAKITNGYNAKREIEFEAYVTGTDENPKVIEFTEY